MSNLPITVSAPQTSAKPAQAVSQPEDNNPQGQPFGNVLAQQISHSVTPDSQPHPKKASAKTAEEIFIRIKAKSDTASPATGAVPADMLAALIPQNMLKPLPSEASAQPKQIKPVLEGIDLTKQTIEKAGLTSTQGSQAIASAHAGMVAAIDTKKDAGFSTIMDSMAATATQANQAANDANAAALTSQSVVAQASMQAAMSQPANTVNVAPLQITINTPVSKDNWGDEFGQKITWMASNKEQTAELHLNPPQLGPMDVVLKVSGDQATALFTSPHAAVRDAIEQALPKLREMMAENGIMLGNASVNDQAPRNNQDDSNNRSSRSLPSINSITDTSATGSLNMRVSTIHRHNGIVDTFA